MSTERLIEIEEAIGAHIDDQTAADAAHKAALLKARAAADGKGFRETNRAYVAANNERGRKIQELDDEYYELTS